MLRTVDFSIFRLCECWTLFFCRRCSAKRFEISKLHVSFRDAMQGHTVCDGSTPSSHLVRTLFVNNRMHCDVKDGRYSFRIGGGIFLFSLAVFVTF